MKKYYVYQLIDPRTNTVFYIGKGSGDRAYAHTKFKDGNNNPYKDRIIKKILDNNLNVIVEFIHTDIDEDTAYILEEQEIKRIGINNLSNIVENAIPPSKKGWHPSKKTLEKRSKSLKGIVRTEEWCQNLSNSKKGKNNPRYGIKEPCSEERRLSVLKGKNLPNYELYKDAIQLMNNGLSADQTSLKLGIGRGVCFNLKNRTHGIFIAFPELCQLKTS
jgi:hypothetical protein